MHKPGKSQGFHESFERAEDIKAGSERSFGLLFVAVFAIVAAWPVLSGGPLRIWALVIAVVLLAVALLVPRVLAPANAAWLRLGLLLAAVVSPIVLALLYYTAFLPTGLLLRLFGKDPLHRQFDRLARSYWIERDIARPYKHDMRNQF